MVCTRAESGKRGATGDGPSERGAQKRPERENETGPGDEFVVEVSLRRGLEEHFVTKGEGVRLNRKITNGDEL